MLLLNGWILFGLAPLYMLYKRNSEHQSPFLGTRLLYIALVCMFFAMSRPALKDDNAIEKFNAHDYIVAIDASYSMQADDIKPNRYTAAKEAIAKLFKANPKERFTLFAFTSNALLLSPPTTDTAISLEALQNLNPEYILSKSTSIYTLLERLAKLPMKEKNLLLFSDGGDEHDIDALSSFANEHNIHISVVAMATQRGAALKKDGRYIKDIYSAIVVSKINPILPELAHATGGKYYEYSGLSTIDSLTQDLQKEHAKELSIHTQNYHELFYIPLLFAMLFFMLAVTNLQKYLKKLWPALFLALSAEASVLDFITLQEAHTAYEKEHYKEAAQNFAQLEPSVESYYNTAVAYYKAGHYKSALNYFTKIETKRPNVKAMILYNMGNCAFKLKRYERAKNFYLHSLALKEDRDALHNLHLIERLHLKSGRNINDMLPPKNPKQKKQHSKSQNKEENNKQSSKGKNNSNQSAQQSSAAAKQSQKKQQEQQKSLSKQKSDNYSFSYKAYEIINKGYTDEKEPW